MGCCPGTRSHTQSHCFQLPGRGRLGERGGVSILPGLWDCCLDNLRGNIEAILLFASWCQERLRCWSQGPLYRQKQRMLAGCWKPVSFAGALPSWHLERLILSDHILLYGGGPEVSWWQRGSQPGSKTHCRRWTRCTYIPELSYAHIWPYICMGTNTPHRTQMQPRDI